MRNQDSHTSYIGKNPKHTRPRFIPVDALVKTRRLTALPALAFARLSSCRLRVRRWVPVPLMISTAVAVFVGGAYFFWSTDNSLTDKRSMALAAAPAVAVVQPLTTGLVSLGPVTEVSNGILFNLTLGQLEDFLATSLVTSEIQEAERLADRKFKLKIYLDNKKSPLLEIADTLAELKHWKLVLAISNSESSLGRNCYNNNCSGIGVAPGHPYWRNYKNKTEWAKDLDNLIEKRYKNWSLEEINGVYNQPGSQNWLMAARQIFEELKEYGIE